MPSSALGTVGGSTTGTRQVARPAAFSTDAPRSSRNDEDLSDCPDAIASVPFLANMLPIAWFAGFDVQVHPAVDAVFAAAQSDLFEVYRAMYPHHRLRPALRASRIASVSWSGSRDLLLFSGGVDSVAAAIDLSAGDVEPVMVQGGDIPGEDEWAWEFRSRILREHPVLGDLRRHVVRSNLRGFYARPCSPCVSAGGGTYNTARPPSASWHRLPGPVARRASTSPRAGCGRGGRPGKATRACASAPPQA